MKKWVLCFLLFSLFLTGCNYTELNELGIIDSLGIEKKDQSYYITMRMINNEEADPTYQIFESHGKTLEEAFQNAYLKSNKKIYLSHLSNVLLKDSIQEEDFKEITTYFVNHPSVRNNFIILILKDLSLKAFYENEENPKHLSELVEVNSKEYGLVNSNSFDDFLKDYYSEYRRPILPVVKWENEMLELEGLAFFQRDEVISLTKEESIVYHLLQGKGTKVTFEDQTYDNFIVLSKIEDKTITFTLFGDTVNPNNTELPEIIEQIANGDKQRQSDFLGFRELYYQNQKNEVALDKIQVKVKTNFVERGKNDEK